MKMKSAISHISLSGPSTTYGRPSGWRDEGDWILRMKGVMSEDFVNHACCTMKLLEPKVNVCNERGITGCEAKITSICLSI